MSMLATDTDMSTQVAQCIRPTPNIRELLITHDKSTLETSASFCKKAVGILMSTFFKVRNVFPMDAFWHTDTQDSIKFELLKRDANLEDAVEVIELMKSSLKGINNGYLDEIRFLFTEEPGLCRPIEELIVKLDYGAAKVSSEKTRKEFESLESTVQNMQDLCEFLQRLPKKGKIFLILLYNEITPEEYEPKLFESFDINTYPKINESKMRIGEVQTRFHRIQLYIRSKILTSPKNNLETKTNSSEESPFQVRFPSRMEKPSHDVSDQSMKETGLSTADLPQDVVKSKVSNKYSAQNKTDLLKRTRSSTGALKTKNENYYIPQIQKKKKRNKYMKKKLNEEKENIIPREFSSSCDDDSNVYDAPAAHKIYNDETDFISTCQDDDDDVCEILKDYIELDAKVYFVNARKASCCVKPAVFGSGNFS